MADLLDGAMQVAAGLFVHADEVGAIANAVCDALGRPDMPITTLPLTPARVFGASRATHPRSGA